MFSDYLQVRDLGREEMEALHRYGNGLRRKCFRFVVAKIFLIL